MMSIAKDLKGDYMGTFIILHQNARITFRVSGYSFHEVNSKLLSYGEKFAPAEVLLFKIENLLPF